MKKKAIRKSKAGTASARSQAKPGKPAKAGPAPKGKAKPKPKPKPKPSKAKASPAKSGPAAKAKSAKATQATKAAKPGKAAKPAKSAQAKTPRKSGRSAPPLSASKGGKGSRKRSAPPAAASLLRKVAPRLREDSGRDTEVTLAPELISRTLPEAVPAEDEGTLRKVMSSLTALFGGRDDLSDAELDALLDSKMASGEIPPSAALDPLDEAQSLVYEAWNSEGPQRVRLARKALETSPDCADAYVILAEDAAGDGREALQLFKKGVEAGERAIGPETFRKSAGRFWEVMEARPYMRARLGLAECLWEQGLQEEALGHLRELLRLDPADNQGVRRLMERYRPGSVPEPG
jgi:tetratricopeptide (TPR) repeat protein